MNKNMLVRMDTSLWWADLKVFKDYSATLQIVLTLTMWTYIVGEGSNNQLLR